ncbi:MAG: sigma 54-interacting transcriptional regulator [bacterium]
MHLPPDPRFSSIIFENIPHGIFTVDEHGHITSFNRAAESITGWTRDEVIGEICSDVFHSDHCENSCFLRQSMEHGEQHRDQEVTITRRDGHKLQVSISTANLADSQGRIRGGVEMFRDLSLLVALRREIQSNYTCDDIISKSSAMQPVREMVRLVAKSSSTVLIDGEQGTGKELIARAIHNLGPRRDQPFVAVNCGALPESLAESELFGHMKGAFTDASKDKPGRFILAEGGTLFLDEVGEISPAMQVKLLRVLQERECTPLGAVAPVKVDVRILAATNRDLSSEVGHGHFRQDLFFRLNVVRINLPPLRVRTEDIPLLVNHFIKKFNALQGRRLTGISERALTLLMHYDYPGNVRELENAVEHAFVICGGAIIEAEDLPPHIRGEQIQPRVDPGPTPAAGVNPLQNAEAAVIREALHKHGGNRTRAAEELGISRNTLWRKMKRHTIE